ncbi:MAG: saccharopine dehydrogenase NADP-binding domain-containing protein [Candidatus Dormibacteria bacterium]
MVYGATGFTGTLTAKAGQRAGLQLVLAGRNPERLARLAREFDDEYPVLVASHDDPVALARVAGAARVLASTAGPFSEVGELTVAAAVAAGRHYLDSTGEVDFMAQTFRRHHRAAQEKEIVVMNACAFEYVIGDCLCALALEAHPGAAALRVSYWMPDKAATRGTARSALGILASREVRDGVGRGVQVDFPDPAGRRWAVTYAGGEVELLRRRRPGLAVSTLMDMPAPVARSARALSHRCWRRAWCAGSWGRPSTASRMALSRVVAPPSSG